MQAIASLSAILGIFWGKYIFIHHYLAELVADGKLQGVTVLPLFSTNAFKFYLITLGNIYHPLDLLWVLLALLTASLMLSATPIIPMGIFNR